MARMTSAELILYNLRQADRRMIRVGAPDGCDRESDLHSQIYNECRRRGWIALHGSMSERSHRTLGEPDFVILASLGRVFFIECKTKTGKLTVEQAALRHQAENLGHEVHVVRSLKEFLNVIETP